MLSSLYTARVLIGFVAGAAIFPIIAFLVMGLSFGFDQVGPKNLIPAAVLGGMSIATILYFICRNRMLFEQKTQLEYDRKLSENASRAKSQFLSSMSHEFRTPLNAILGFGQLLENNPKEPLSDIQRKHTLQILESGYHLLELVNQVLDLSKIEQDSFDLRPEHIMPSDVFRECLEMVRPMAEEKNITMSGERGEINGIFVDRSRFKQIVLNLMSNGIKYNKAGGELSFGCKQTDGQKVRIHISDTGSGISIEKQDKLFEPFNRLGKESSDIPGTGIGLTITKRLVEAMDGEIGFESTSGRGTTFWIDFRETEANGT